LSNCVNITDRTLTALANGCAHLRILELAGCSHLTDAGFAALVKNCHELTRMDLEDCNQITDTTLANLAAGCPRMEALSLSHCELVGDDGIRQLAVGLADRSALHTLELDNCPLISDASLDHLRMLSSLENVDLYDCQLMTKSGIRRFQQHLPWVSVHAYFAPTTPEAPPVNRRRGICQCCAII